jgi:hypothetical protein
MTRYASVWDSQPKFSSFNAKKVSNGYINFPSAIAQAMDFSKGEDVQWTIADKGHLILSRDLVPPNPIDLKKTSLSASKSKS